MADLKISQLPDAAVPLEDEDYIPVVQGTDTEPSTNKVRVSELKAAVEVMSGKLDNAFKFPVSEGNLNEHSAEILYPKDAYYAGGYGNASGIRITGILEIRLPEFFYNNRVVKIKGKIERANPYETIDFQIGGYFSGDTTHNWWAIYDAIWTRSLDDLKDLRVRFGYTLVGSTVHPTIYIGEITTEWSSYGSFVIEQASINNDPISDSQLEGMKTNWQVKIIDSEDIVSNLSTNFVPETDLSGYAKLDGGNNFTGNQSLETLNVSGKSSFGSISNDLLIDPVVSIRGPFIPLENKDGTVSIYGSDWDNVTYGKDKGATLCFGGHAISSSVGSLRAFGAIGALKEEADSGVSGYLVFGTRNNQTNTLTEKARISSKGNLIINSKIDDGNNKLQVNGTISANGGTAPDQVVIKSQLDTKLDASLYNDRFKGKYTSLTNLQSAYPTANVGDYAQVDEGSGFDVVNYNWDTEGGWVEGGSGSAATTTDALPEGSINLYFTDARAQTAVTSELALKANELDVIHKTGDETINGIKTFNNVLKAVGMLETPYLAVKNQAVPGIDLEPTVGSKFTLCTVTHDDPVLGGFGIYNSTANIWNLATNGSTNSVMINGFNDNGSGSKLQVNGTISADSPTVSNHVATKEYVDNAITASGVETTGSGILTIAATGANVSYDFVKQGSMVYLSFKIGPIPTITNSGQFVLNGLPFGGSYTGGINTYFGVNVVINDSGINLVPVVSGTQIRLKNSSNVDVSYTQMSGKTLYGTAIYRCENP